MKNISALVFIGLFGTAVAATEATTTTVGPKDQVADVEKTPTKEQKDERGSIVITMTGKKLLEFMKNHPLISVAGAAITGAYLYKEIPRAFERFFDLTELLVTSGALTYLATVYERKDLKDDSFCKQHAWAIAWTIACGLVSVPLYINGNVPGVITGVRYAEGTTILAAAIHYLITTDGFSKILKEDSAMADAESVPA